MNTPTGRFVRHYLEMLVAMVIGMVALAPLWPPLLESLGVTAVGTEASTLIMATNMSIAMAAWMAFRRHGWRPIVEMCAAMYLAFVVLFPPLWAGWLTAMDVMMIGHVLMLVTMLLAMLWRREEYSCGATRTATGRRHPVG